MKFKPQILSDFLTYQAVFSRHLGKTMARLPSAVVASLAEGFGILMMLPLLEGLSINNTTSDNSQLNRSILWIMQSIGLAWFDLCIVVRNRFVSLKGLITFFAHALIGRLCADLLKKVRSRLYGHYTSMTYSYFIEKSAGHFTNIINDQTPRMVLAFDCLVNFAAALINVLLLLAFAFAIAWQFGISVMLLGMVIVLCFKKLNDNVQLLSRKTAEKDIQLSSWMVQTLNAFKYLTSISKRDVAAEPITQAISDVSDIHLRHKLARALITSIREPIAVSVIVTIVLFQTQLLEKPLEPILVSVVLLYRCLNAVLSAQNFWVGTLTNVGSVEKVEKELNLDVSERRELEKYTSEVLDYSIEFDQMSFTYEGRPDPTLDGISMLMPQNHTYAIVGESGAGKSTFFDLVTLLQVPTKGVLRLGGVNSVSLDKSVWRSNIGIVTQDVTLFDDTIENNITLWDKAKSNNKLHKAAKDAALLDFIETLPEGFNTLIGEKGAKLSGGQKQRLSLARELYREPKVLLLDEATSALDTKSEAAILESLKILDGRMTILIIAHRLSSIKDASKIYVLKGGQMVETGGYLDLKTQPGSELSRMIAAQKI